MRKKMGMEEVENCPQKRLDWKSQMTVTVVFDNDDASVTSSMISHVLHWLYTSFAVGCVKLLYSRMWSYMNLPRVNSKIE
jgi:hypothetical protein